MTQKVKIGKGLAKLVSSTSAEQIKAKELYLKYAKLLDIQDLRAGSNPYVRKCAAIVVEEIIQALETTAGHCTLRKLDRQEVQHDFEYWNRVKNEIQNL